jgi:hypothetical protein
VSGKEEPIFQFGLPGTGIYLLLRTLVSRASLE